GFISPKPHTAVTLFLAGAKTAPPTPRRQRDLPPPPLWRPLRDEGVYALLRILRQHVAGNHLAGGVVRVRQAEFELAVEEPLAGGDRDGALRENGLRKLLDLGIQLVFGDDAVNESSLEGSPSVDKV